jgi:hypothetical protein
MAKLDRVQPRRGYDVEAVRYLNRARKAAGSIDGDSEASVTWLLSAANVLATLDLADAIRSREGDLGAVGAATQDVGSLPEESGQQNSAPDIPARAE